MSERAARNSVSENGHIVFMHALSGCSLMRRKQERIGTKGDGVELLAGANVLARTKVFAPEHFCPVPVVPEFAHTIRTTA